VLSCGQRTSATRRCGDILTGELLAILYGVQAAIREHQVPVSGEGTVVVQSDSRPALRLLRTVRAGRYPEACTTNQIRVARKVIEECGIIPIQFRWVKGHHGNELNEGADRLAVLARRNQEFGVEAGLGQKMADVVRDELFAASA
jgi:ribonuclease HI